MSTITTTISNETEQYRTGYVDIGGKTHFSQHKLIERIRQYQNKTYPTGKVSKDGDYKYWVDIVTPRVNDNVKNLRFESKNILPFSIAPQVDFAPVFVLRASLVNWMRDHRKDEEIQEVLYTFCDDGNILWKKCGKDYEITDPDNTFITNQTARTVDETSIIHRTEMTQSDLRAKSEWKNIEDVIAECGVKQRVIEKNGTPIETSNLIYEIYERNGEVSEKTLFEAQGKKNGDENKFVLARIIVALHTNTEKSRVLFAEAFPDGKKMSDYYIEAHYGAYKGRWWREGLREILFDQQFRSNEIAQQIARGLEWASKVVFKDENPQLFNNIKTQITNGRIIKSATLQQVEVRMQGFDQLLADWNRNLETADKLANSYEIVSGESLGASVPFRMGALLDQNANKLFVHLRSKFGVPYARVFETFILPEMVKDISAKEIINLTGDDEMIVEFKKILVQSWYLDNLAKIGPHTPEMAEQLKALKMSEIQEPMIANTREIWKGVLPRLHVTITGDNFANTETLQTISSMLQFEQDPVRRAFLMDYIYRSKNIPIPPEVQQLQQQQAPQQVPTNEPLTV
jgi:hypothetical protein